MSNQFMKTISKCNLQRIKKNRLIGWGAKIKCKFDMKSQSQTSLTLEGKKIHKDMRNWHLPFES